LERGWIEGVQLCGDPPEQIREVMSEVGKATEGSDPVESSKGWGAGGMVHEQEGPAHTGVGSTGQADSGHGETLPGDLALEHRFLRRPGWIRHDPQDEGVGKRRSHVDQRHQAHRGPEPSSEFLRLAGKLGVLETRLGPQQLDQPVHLPKSNSHGVYRNGIFRYCPRMSVVTANESGWPVEALAARAGLPVRTIREYQTMRVLQPPVRRGRVGFYDSSHLQRLTLIARLQERGYSLAGIRDLFDAWAAGQDLAGVLAGPDGALIEEAPAVLDRRQFEAAVSHLPTDRFHELVSLGVVIHRSEDEYCVPSPSLLNLLDDALGNGISVDDALAVVKAIATGVRSIADSVAATLDEALCDRTEDEAVAPLLRRGRVLVAQATSRLLLHELGLALTGASGRPPDRRIAGLVDQLRVGRSPVRPEKSQRKNGKARDGE
jgi:DNA-binding transcriptional MerR regulator